MIIGLCGYKNSGKDTVGMYLVKQHGFERRSFADKLKESAAALFGVEAWQIEEMKNDPQACIAQLHMEGPYHGAKIDGWGPAMTVREMLQRYGTEAHRNIFGMDFWVDQVLPVGGFYSGRAIVVTDVRFPNEIDRITDIGGHVVFVDRPSLDLQDPHSSENEGILQAKRYGYHLRNSGTVSELFKNAERMLDELG